MVGPLRSGKTSLVAALARTSPRDPTGGVARIVRPGDGFQAFIDEAARGFRAHLGRTTSPAWFRDGEVEIETSLDNAEPSPAATWVVREVHASLVFGPGDYPAPRLALFGPPLHGDGAYGWKSMALVLCVDAQEPQPDEWHDRLTSSLATWRRAAALMRARGGGPADLDERLPFDRILLLLTKFDRFCDLAGEMFETGGDPSFEPFKAIPALRLAERLDPLHQVRDVVRGKLLDVVRAHAHAFAQVAVGMVSARGFRPAAAENGDDEAGAPGWHYGDWEPFGVREVLAFLDGERARFPLAELDVERLHDDVVALTGEA